MKNDLLSRDTITLVRDSWTRVVPGRPRVAERFYANLFSLDPALESLFQCDLEIQGQRLLRMIDVAIGQLDDPDGLIPLLQNLGCRHVAYGVENAHYETVGSALMLTLAQSLGEDFTDPLREAWTRVYALIAGIMKEAAYNDV